MATNGNFLVFFALLSTGFRTANQIRVPIRYASYSLSTYLLNVCYLDSCLLG